MSSSCYLFQVWTLVGFLRWLAKYHSCSHSPALPRLRLLFPTTAQKSSCEEVCLTSTKPKASPLADAAVQHKTSQDVCSNAEIIVLSNKVLMSYLLVREANSDMVCS